MITDNELQISNMSYTEKDYASIYPALLDLVKQLTNKWDPSISNESDPGNVLLKLLAAIGDKNNYNIDKNVLECFMPSATQETSMRMLTEAVGYNMRYYQSALTDITFKYTSDISTPINFGRFSTVVSNKDGSVAYTLIEDAILTYKNVAVSALAIEGQLTDLKAGDSTVIKLDNLDDNNRLYFPEIYVAENGVFITNDGAKNFNEWTRVDNLNTQQPLTRCYKFGFDSQAELPYIEFPTDIAQLIGSGILVSYIVTTADAGNVSAGVLTQVVSSDSTDWSSENLVVFNASAAINGKQKETIDEAYNNFKKIIGTFDTLVTTRDYGNAMYNLADEYNQPIVSNAMASDRTNDVNFGLKVVTYDSQGQYTELIPTDDMSVSDITLYPLQPYKGENYNAYNPSYIYDNSYLPLKVRSGDYYVDDVVLTNDLDGLKCIGHTFKRLEAQDSIDETEETPIVYNFLNIASLDVQIFTYAKVNKIAQADIKANVLKALSDNFNARMVDYGYEIPYNTLLDVIYGADSRIKLVNLAEPVYRTDILFPSGDTEGITDGDLGVITNVVSKNVLAGKLSLFLYDERFEWKFGQTDIQTYDNVEKITTALVLPHSGDFEYELKENEVIQLISPNLNTTLIYPAGVYYRFTSTGSDSSSTAPIILAGTDYKIQSTQLLKLYYVDSDENTHKIDLESGTIIKPNFDMYYTGSTGTITVDNLAYNKIATNKTIEVRDFITIKLDNVGTPIYWIRKNDGNVLFEAVDNTVTSQSVVLDTDEYFIYSNSNFDDLVVVGAGTKITRGGTAFDRTRWAITNTVSAESINLSGVNAFKQSDWQYKQLNGNTNYVELQEMQIITLGEGASVEIDGWTGSDPVASEWTTLDDDVEITINLSNGTTQTLPALMNAEINWQIRSRLDLNGGPDTPQILMQYKDGSNNVISQQTLFLTMTNGTFAMIEGDNTGHKCVLFNYPLQMAGGSNLDMKVTNILLGTNAYELSVCEYTSVSPTSSDITDGTAGDGTLDASSKINISLDENKVITLPMSIDYINSALPSQEEIELGVGVGLDYKPFGTYIVPILFTQGSDGEPGYTPLGTTQPEDWSTNYMCYYKKLGNNYFLNTSSTWSDNTLYRASITTVSVSSNCADIYNYNVYDELGNKVSINAINASGLYNLELVAKWLGEYGTQADLVGARKEYTLIYLDEEPSDWGTPGLYYYKNGNFYYDAAETVWQSNIDYYVKPNTVGDICKVDGYTAVTLQPVDWDSAWFTYYVRTGTSASNYVYKLNTSSTWDSSKYYYKSGTPTFYSWNGAQWTAVSNSSPDKYYLKFVVSVDPTQPSQSFISIGSINKIEDLNPVLVSSVSGDMILERIRTLTDGITNADGEPVTFYYTYTPDNSDVIEANNILDATAFWDVNNVANRFTIPKLDLENSNIYIARASQL